MATGRAERDAPTLKGFFFFGGGGGGRGVRSGGIFGGEMYLGQGLGRGGGSRSVGIFGGRGGWAGVWVEGEGLGVGVFSGDEVLGRGSG